MVGLVVMSAGRAPDPHYLFQLSDKFSCTKRNQSCR